MQIPHTHHLKYDLIRVSIGHHTRQRTQAVHTIAPAIVDDDKIGAASVDSLRGQADTYSEFTRCKVLVVSTCIPAPAPTIISPFLAIFLSLPSTSVRLRGGAIALLCLFLNSSTLASAFQQL